MITYLGSLVQLGCGEWGTLQTNITGVCGECSQYVWTTLALHPLMMCVLSLSTLLRLQVALQGNCPRQALGFMDFLGLKCSVSGSWVLHKGTDSVGPAFCVLPTSEQLRRPGAQCARHLRCAVCLLWGADLWLRSSWQMSTIQDPRKT